MTNHQACQLAWQKLAEGQNHPARELFAQVLLADANYAAALHGMGYLAWIEGRPNEAITWLLRAARADPKRADVYLHLAAAYEESKQAPRAIEALGRAIQIDPRQARYHAALAAGLASMQRLPEALASYRRALELEPRNVNILASASDILRTMDQAGEAETLARQALAIEPANTYARSALAAALELQGDLAAAESEYRAALVGDSENADLHSSLADVLLTCGELREGFAEYEWRFRAKSTPLVIPEFSSPRWDGSEIPGRTLLVQWEQGLGDTIQFARLLPLAAKRCGRVVFRCQAALAKLIASGSFEKVEVDADTSTSPTPTMTPTPPHDTHIPMLCLARALGITLETIPSDVPYLRADAALVERWRSALPPRRAGEMRVGLAWKGASTHSLDSVRSMDVASLAPLAKLRNVTWISLHKDPATPANTAPPLVEPPADLRHLDATAALMMHLDLVLTVDTSMAHLAGALGRPVWLMLCTRSDWRWMLNRSDSPWYPTMRLFRQRRPRDWSSVLEDVCRALAEPGKC